MANVCLIDELGSAYERNSFTVICFHSSLTLEYIHELFRAMYVSPSVKLGHRGRVQPQGFSGPELFDRSHVAARSEPEARPTKKKTKTETSRRK